VALVGLAAFLGGAALAGWALFNPHRPPQPSPAGPQQPHAGSADWWYAGREPRLGEPARDLTLSPLSSSGEVQLHSLLGRKPLVLVFGSLTCNLFYDHVPALEHLYQAYHDRADFLLVYLREAGHPMPGVEFLLPPGGAGQSSPRLPREEHRLAARRAMAVVGLHLPTALDTEDGQAMTRYAAFPLRLVVLDAGGRVALDLGRGTVRPWDLGLVEHWLRDHATAGATPESPEPGVPQ
jgi:hypothetical protein